MNCCLCHKPINEQSSHNAQPLGDGRCCGDCNEYVVLRRILMASAAGTDTTHPHGLSQNGKPSTAGGASAKSRIALEEIEGQMGDSSESAPGILPGNVPAAAD